MKELINEIDENLTELQKKKGYSTYVIVGIKKALLATMQMILENSARDIENENKELAVVPNNSTTTKSEWIIMDLTSNETVNPFSDPHKLRENSILETLNNSKDYKKLLDKKLDKLIKGLEGEEHTN